MARRPLSYVSAADLLDPEPDLPVEPAKPTRRSTLRGKVIRRREPRPCVDTREAIAAMLAAANDH